MEADISEHRPGHWCEVWLKQPRCREPTLNPLLYFLPSLKGFRHLQTTCDQIKDHASNFYELLV